MPKKKRIKPPKWGRDYRSVHRLVDGAVRGTFIAHPEYLTEKGNQFFAARRSLVKRVTGAVLGFAKEKAKVRSGA